MPHLTMLYTPQLDRPAAEGGSNMGLLCRRLADTLLAQRDEAGGPVFPPGGIRVLAFPSTHHAVADGGAAGRAAAGSGDYVFVYLNLRMARGRSTAVQQQVGRALEACAREHLAPQLSALHMGLTVQIDEGHEVFDGKTSTLHPLFRKD